MEEDFTSETSIPIPIFETKKRQYKKKDKNEEVEKFMDEIIASISRMSINYENEIRGLKILIVAAILKSGGKLTIGKDIMSLAGEKFDEIQMTEDNNFTKLTV